MSISDIKPLSSHIFVGFVESLDGDSFKFTVIKQYSGADVLKGTILIKQLPMSKPSENPEVGRIYLVFAKKVDSHFKIARRLEIGDFSVNSHELNEQKIKTQCEFATTSCLLK